MRILPFRHHQDTRYRKISRKIVHECHALFMRHSENFRRWENFSISMEHRIHLSSSYFVVNTIRQLSYIIEISSLWIPNSIEDHGILFHLHVNIVIKTFPWSWWGEWYHNFSRLISSVNQKISTTNRLLPVSSNARKKNRWKNWENLLVDIIITT